jgi:hypothetical protein
MFRGHCKKGATLFVLILLVFSVFVAAGISPPSPPFQGDDDSNDGANPIDTGEDNTEAEDGNLGSSQNDDLDQPINPPTTHTYDSTLKITKVVAEVDGKEDTTLRGGRKISKKAKEESDIKFEIEIQNVWDKHIEDIEVIVTIEDANDGDDIDERSSTPYLEPDSSSNLKFDFELPLMIDDDDYDVIIDVEGIDSEGNSHVFSWELILEVEKDKHKIKVLKADISPTTISCFRQSSLKLSVLNLGREEEIVDVSIKSVDLEFGIESSFELGVGTDNDAEYEKTYKFKVPSYISEGIYPIELIMGYDDKKYKDISYLEIDECEQLKEEANSVLLDLRKGEHIITGNVVKEINPSPVIKYELDNKLIILFLTLFVLILMGAMIFLGGAIMLELKK